MSTAKAQLSCEQCQRRKVKCNKAVPTCGACHAAQISCSPISRQRLPRGRSGRSKNSKASLADRLSRLEGAISQIRDGKLPSSVSNEASGAQNVSSEYSEASVSSYVAADFWSSLAEAVDEVKEILDDRVDSAIDGQDYDNTTEPHGIDNAMFLFGHADNHITDPEMSSLTHAQLLNLYKTRFQPMFDTLDHEDLRSVEGLKASGPGSDRHSSMERKVLTAAVHFGAVCTLLSRETDKRQAMMLSYRLNVERLLCQASFMTSPTVALLQAFIIYLAALRSCQANAQQWTMIPLAIRIAEALGMPKNLQDNRKAIWFSIGMLDIQASFDRGSKPLMLVEDFSDSMESADSSIIHFEHSAAKTAMWRAMMCNRTLFDYNSYQRSLVHQFRTWSEWQHAVLQEFENYVERLSMICDNLGASATHLQTFTVCIARESLLSMRLLLARPLYDYNRAKEPDDAEADDSLHVLQMAVDLLLSAQMKADPEYDIYGWYSWVKWYALAIALSELCKQPCNQDTLHAWEVTKSSFKAYARLVADTEVGLLWRPIAKLMRRTEERWEKAIEQQSTMTINNVYDTFDQKYDLDPWTFFTLDFKDQSMLDDFDPAAWLMD